MIQRKFENMKSGHSEKKENSEDNQWPQEKKDMVTVHSIFNTCSDTWLAVIKKSKLCGGQGTSWSQLSVLCDSLMLKVARTSWGGR